MFLLPFFLLACTKTLIGTVETAIHEPGPVGYAAWYTHRDDCDSDIPTEDEPKCTWTKAFGRDVDYDAALTYPVPVDNDVWEYDLDLGGSDKGTDTGEPTGTIGWVFHAFTYDFDGTKHEVWSWCSSALGDEEIPVDLYPAVVPLSTADTGVGLACRAKGE